MRENSAQIEKLKNGGILLAYPDSEIISRLRDLPCLAPGLRWAYLGEDYRKMIALERGILAGIKRISYSNDLNRTAALLRTPFLEWIENLGHERNSLPWWAGTIADKNPQISPLFQSICYLNIARELIRKESELGLLLVVEHQGLLHQIASLIAPEKLILAEESGRKRLRPMLGNLVKLFTFHLLYLVRITRELRIAHRSRQAVKKENKEPEARALFLIYADNHSLLPEGRFNDRFFDGLPDWMSRQGYQISRLPFIYRWSGPWSEAVCIVRACGPGYFLMQDYLHFHDYLWAVLRTLIHWRPRRYKSLEFAGLPVDKIIRDEAWSLRSSCYVPDRLVILPFLQRLSRKNPDITLFIYPYENMSWEKIFCYGVHKYFPRAKLVGFQHSDLSPTMHNYFPSQFEWNSPLTPHLVVSDGEEFYDLMKQEGYPQERLALGCALRFADLFMLKSNFKIPPSPSGHKPVILVAFSYIISETVHLLCNALEAFTDSRDLEVWLKPHPTLLPAERMLDMLPGRTKLPGHFRMVEGSFLDYIVHSNLLLYTSGSAVYQALVLGIPAIHLVPELTIDQDYPTFKHSSQGLRRVTNPEELKNVSFELLNLDQAQQSNYAHWGPELVARYFTPVKEDRFSVFYTPSENVKDSIDKSKLGN